MDSQLIESQLIEYLQNERVEVTYKMLSRKCSITVNQAKKALEQFYNKVSLSKSSSLGLIPLYFLCKNSNEYYVGVKPDLGEAGIDSIKVLHAYALSPTTREAAKQRIIDGTIEVVRRLYRCVIYSTLTLGFLVLDRFSNFPVRWSR